MAFVDWSDEYSLDNPAIDAQHKRLFQIVNELHDAVYHRMGREVVGKTIAELIDYTHVHFADEEREMVAFDFPEYPQHQAAHQELVLQVQNIDRKFKAGDDTIAAEILCFLVGEWLIKHIFTMDRRLADYIHQAAKH